MDANETIKVHVDALMKVVTENTQVVDGETKASTQGVGLLMAQIMNVPAELREVVINRFEAGMREIIV